MVDRGPLLTSAIIFYLAIGAAIFEVLEEPHWKEAKKNYYTQKLHLLKEFPCLSQEGLDKILQVSRRSPEAVGATAVLKGRLPSYNFRRNCPLSPTRGLGVAGRKCPSGVRLQRSVFSPETRGFPTRADLVRT